MRSLAFYKRLRAMGMDEAMALQAAEAFEQEVALAVAAALEPRRAKDRERKQRVRGCPRNSTEAADFQEPPAPPLSPQTPQTPPHPRESITSREEREREEAGWVRFWTDYPRKVSKADARKAFAKAWRKLPPFDEDAILSGGLERAKAGWDDPRFIPHAATWLNREQWNDEPEPSTVIPMRPRHERPHPDDKLSRKEANLARSLAGFDAVAGRRRIEP